MYELLLFMAVLRMNASNNSVVISDVIDNDFSSVNHVHSSGIADAF